MRTVLVVVVEKSVLVIAVGTSVAVAIVDSVALCG